MRAFFGTSSLTPRRFVLLMALSCSGLVTSPVDATDVSSRQDTRQTLSDAGSPLWDTVSQRLASQPVLEGYLTYHRLIQALPNVSATAITQFIETHQDSPLSEWLLGHAQLEYGKAGNTAALLAISNSTPPKNLQARCYVLSARLTQAGPDAKRAVDEARELWRSGQLLPACCEALFDQLHHTARLNGADDWPRMMTLWRKGNLQQAKLLRAALSAAPAWQSALSAFEAVRLNPEAVAQLPAALGPPGAHARDTLIYSALSLYARQDTASALSFWVRYGDHIALAPDDRTQLEHDLLLQALTHQTPGFNDWIDQKLVHYQDDELTLLRLRSALLAQSWPEVIRWVGQLSPTTRDDSRWQYWRGRALAALDRQQEAHDAFLLAAKGTDFYAFVAADRLHLPYALPAQPETLESSTRQRFVQLPAIQRIQALYRIDEPSLALSEWQWLLKSASADERQQLAMFAQEQRWYTLTVTAALDRRIWKAVQLRFPLAFPELFSRWAALRQIDSYLLMGVARRESAYNPTIQSPVGARGLMQLMPATARHVSRKEAIAYSDVSDLNDPNTNIALGSAYLRSLLNRYQSNRIAAVAAYNAGPNRVDRWLSSGDLPFDLFIEQIPFRETREYVLAVLSYRVILAHQAMPTSQVQVLTPPERMRTYNSDLVNFQPDM